MSPAAPADQALAHAISRRTRALRTLQDARVALEEAQDQLNHCDQVLREERARSKRK